MRAWIAGMHACTHVRTCAYIRTYVSRERCRHREYRYRSGRAAYESKFRALYWLSPKWRSGALDPTSQILNPAPGGFSSLLSSYIDITPETSRLKPDPPKPEL